jgi:hypothetical protein
MCVELARRPYAAEMPKTATGMRSASIPECEERT